MKFASCSSCTICWNLSENLEAEDHICHEQLCKNRKGSHHTLFDDLDLV